MQIENISAIPTEIDTVEKLYLWCYYQLSSTNERVEIEGEKEYLVDSELIRPDGVDPRLFLITKINLPIDENWLINGFKLWENANEILNGLIESPVPLNPFIDDLLIWCKCDELPLLDEIGDFGTITHNGIALNANNKKFGSNSLYFNGYRYVQFTLNQFVTSDLTIEFWVKSANNWSNWPPKRLLGWKITNSFYNRIENGLQYEYSQNKKLIAYLNPSSQGGSVSTTINSAIPDQWQHIAFVKTGTNYRIYIDGVLRGSINLLGSFELQYIRFGSNWYETGSFFGYLDNLAITKCAKYTQNFNPETDTYLAY